MFHSKTKVGYRRFNISNKESLEWNLWNTNLFETIWVFWGIINKAKWNSSTAVFTNMLITLCFTQTRIPALVINRNFSIVSAPCSWDEGKKNQVVHDIFPCLRPLKAGVVVSLLVAVICSGWSGTRANSQYVHNLSEVALLCIYIIFGFHVISLSYL